MNGRNDRITTQLGSFRDIHKFCAVFRAGVTLRISRAFCRGNGVWLVTLILAFSAIHKIDLPVILVHLSHHTLIELGTILFLTYTSSSLLDSALL